MCENIMEKKTKGNLISKEYDMKLPAIVRVTQSTKGILKASFEIQNHNEDLEELFDERNRISKFKFEGETSNKNNLKMEEFHIFGFRMILGSGEFSPKEVKIEASSSTETSYSDPYLKFGLRNFRMPGYEPEVDTELETIRFERTEFYKEAIEKIEQSKEGRITSYAYIDNPNLDGFSPSEYLSKAEKEIDRIAKLWGFAQGTYQSRSYGEFFDCNDRLIIGKYINPKKKNIAFRELIPYPNLGKYLNQTYDQYKNKNNDLDLSLVIEYYIDSLTETMIESRYLKAYICLEILVNRFSKINNQEFIIKDGEKFDEFGEKISDKAKDILDDMDFEENEEDIMGKIPSKLKRKLVNRYSLPKKLSLLLEEYQIGYKDLFDDIGKMARTRNNITHRGVPDGDYPEVNNIMKRMFYLIQRILLSLLQYDGKYIVDWKNSGLTSFSRDPNGDYSDRADS